MTVEELIKHANLDEATLQEAEKRLDARLSRWQRREKLKKQVMGFCESLTAKPKTVDWRPVAA